MSPGGRRDNTAVKHGATRPAVGLLGLFGVGNLGNDGSFEVGLAMAREFAPGADVVCITPSPTDIERRYAIPTMKMREPLGMPSWLGGRGRRRLFVIPIAEARRWIDTLRAARRLSVVLVPGTGVLDDFGLRPQGVPYILFRWALCSRLVRTPFAFVGIGAGPIEHPVSRRLMGWAARLATHRSYRDHGSAEYMAELGAPGDFTPDIVFADLRLKSDPNRCRRTSSGVIAVGVMSYAGWTDHVDADGTDAAASSDRYLARLIDLVGRLLDDGKEVTLLIGAESDLDAVADVIAGVEAAGHSTGRLRVPEITSLEDLCREFAAADSAIVTRYHNLVCSLIGGTPCVPTGYEARFDELSELVDLSAFGHRAASFDPAAVLADLPVADDELCRQSGAVAARLVEFDEIIRRDFARLFADL